MSNEKLVRKVLRTLSKRFAHKVTVIEEAQDLTTMRIDELIGNLTTFEKMFESSYSNKNVGITLQARCEDKLEEDLDETVSLLAKNFNKTLKRFYKKPYSGRNCLGFNDKWIHKGWKNSKFGGSNNGFNQQNKGTGMQWKECKGFGYIQKNQELMKRVEEQRVEICSLEEKIQGMIKGIKMINSRKAVLDEILLQGKRSGDNTRIGFSGESSKNRMTSPSRKWVAVGAKSNHNSERKFNWRFYYCGKKGHIAPYCYKIYGKERSKYGESSDIYFIKSNGLDRMVF
ncbi:hypothetical protein LIER_43786 [Lithospermum erythrorhizon]|uniref:Gag-pol polyprotein n=1 Tax=Lithospermum erythrorhizon TaxID=34254 RepID=A0AAV3QVG3_LITER